MSAIFYSIDSYSQLTQYLFLLNPIYLFIRYFRKIVIDGVIPSLPFHCLGAAYAVVAFTLGCMMYKRFNQEFLYYI
jgi:ABC-2 type transport system permease protein